MLYSIEQMHGHSSVGGAILTIVHMEKAIVLKDTFCILAGCVKESIVLDTEYVDDSETMPSVMDPLEITMFFPMRQKEGVIETTKKYVAELSRFRFAVVQTNPDGSQSVLSRGNDEDAVSRYAGLLVLCKTGKIIDAEALASALSYECDGIVLRVLPYEFNLIQSI